MSAPTPTPPSPAKRGPGRPRLSESGPKRVRPKQKAPPSMSKVGKKASPEARKRAAAVLEVLGGVRSTTDAAQALGYSVPRYYQLEARAIEGLVSACEPTKPGRAPSPSREIEVLRKKCARLERELGRQQALVRAAHRSVGLMASAPPKPKGKRAPKRPTARALVAAQVLTTPPASEAPSTPPPASPETP